MFGYHMPVELYFGKDCIKEYGKEMARLGKRALIVTGSRSSRINGSLGDVETALKEAGITYHIFNEVESNPSVQTVRKAAQLGRDIGAEFVVGIGGGSPMDAAKAIAVLCTNDIEDSALFANQYTKPLPIVAVTTTSGTGSEVTQYAVLTNPAVGTKMGISTKETFPTISYADPSYTMGIKTETTIHTAIDALSHAIEGYFSRRSTAVSDMWAEESLRILGPRLGDLREELDYAAREDLMYGAVTAGIVISQTGTTLVHGMGYPLTYYKGLDHGLANGVLFPAYMELMQEYEPDKVEKVLDLLNLKDLAAFTDLLQYLQPERVELTEEEIEHYTRLTLPTNAVKNTAADITESIIKEIYRSLK